jgi:hypothetical protein
MRKKDQTSTCRRIQVRAAPGTEPWVPSPDDLADLACSLTNDVVVEIHPRADVDRVWADEHEGAALPVDRYAFRAFANGRRAVLFVDASETRDSVLWLLVHELTHLELPQSRLLEEVYRNRERDPAYLHSDEAHEADLEERFANQIADAMMARIGRPTGLDRRWWRSRVQRMSGHPLAHRSVSR